MSEYLSTIVKFVGSGDLPSPEYVAGSQTGDFSSVLLIIFSIVFFVLAIGISLYIYATKKNLNKHVGNHISCNVKVNNSQIVCAIFAIAVSFICMLTAVVTAKAQNNEVAEVQNPIIATVDVQTGQVSVEDAYIKKLVSQDYEILDTKTNYCEGITVSDDCNWLITMDGNTLYDGAAGETQEIIPGLDIPDDGIISIKVLNMNPDIAKSLINKEVLQITLRCEDASITKEYAKEQVNEIANEFNNIVNGYTNKELFIEDKVTYINNITQSLASAIDDIDSTGEYEYERRLLIIKSFQELVDSAKEQVEITVSEIASQKEEATNKENTTANSLSTLLKEDKEKHHKMFNNNRREFEKSTSDLQDKIPEISNTERREDFESLVKFLDDSFVNLSQNITTTSAEDYQTKTKLNGDVSTSFNTCLAGLEEIRNNFTEGTYNNLVTFLTSTKDTAINNININSDTKESATKTKDDAITALTSKLNEAEAMVAPWERPEWQGFPEDPGDEIIINEVGGEYSFSTQPELTDSRADEEHDPGFPTYTVKLAEDTKYNQDDFWITVDESSHNPTLHTSSTIEEDWYKVEILVTYKQVLDAGVQTTHAFEVTVNVGFPDGCPCWGFDNLSKTLYLAPIKTDQAKQESKAMYKGISSEEDIPWKEYLNLVEKVKIQKVNDKLLKPKLLDYYFYNLVVLTGVDDLWNLDTSCATSMAHMFEHDSNLRELDLTAFKIDNMTSSSSVYCMFRGCSKLERIWANDDFDFSEYKNPVEMFAGCTSLKGTQGFKYETDKVNSVYSRVDKGFDTESKPGYFSDKTAEKLFWGIVPNEESQNEDTYKLCISPSKTEEATNEDELPLYNISLDVHPAWVDDSNYSKVVNVDFQELSNVKISPRSTCNWFTNSGLKIFNFNGQFDYSKLKNTAGMFSNCSSIQSIDLTIFDSSNVQDMTNMFLSCTSLTTIYQNDDAFTTEKVVNSNNMFLNDTKLEGGCGTPYNSGKTNKEYAWPDGKDSKQGYFTDTSIPAAAYCGLSSDCKELYISKVLTDQANIPCSRILYGFTSCDLQPWHNDRQKIEKVYIQKVEGVDLLKPNDMTRLFSELPNCSEINGLENIDTSNVTTMSYLFNGDSSLQEIDFSGHSNNEKLVNINHMFNHCTNLKTVDFTSFDATTINDMSFSFEYCSKLENVNFDSFQPYNVENTTWMFTNCAQLKQLDLSNFKAPNLSNASYMFAGCSSLVTIYANEDFDFSKLVGEKENSIFLNCTSIIGGNCTFYDPNFVKKSYARIDKEGLPGYFTDKNTVSAYYGLNDNKDNLYISPSKTDIAFYPCSKIVSGFSSLDNIPWKKYFESINSVTIIPNESDTFKLNNMSYLFAGLKNCSEINGIEKLDTSEVTSMAHLFDGGSTFKYLDISSFRNDKLNDVSAMFMSCTNLITIIVDPNNWNSEVEYSQKEATFSGCSSKLEATGEDGSYNSWSEDKIDGSLAHIQAENNPGYFSSINPKLYYGIVDDADSKTLYLSGYKNETASMENSEAIYADPSKQGSDCGWDDQRDQITAVVVGKALRPISMSYWFSNFTSCSSIDILNLHTKYSVNMSSMFENCSSITNLDLTMLDTQNVTDMKSMFKGCSQLQKIEVLDAFVSDNVTSSSDMFLNDENLKGEFNSAYDENHIDKEYARIDEHRQPGYFTYKSDGQDHLYWGDEQVGDKEWIIYLSRRVTKKSTKQDDGSLNPSDQYKIAWHAHAYETVSVIVENTISPKSTKLWFSGFNKCKEYDLYYLNTSKTINMSYMFYRSFDFTSVDISGFDTHQVNNFTYMFNSCENLQTVYAGSGFNADGRVGTGMFTGCEKIKGELGTTFKPDHIDCSYARIDEYNKPGYFTFKYDKDELYYGIQTNEDDKVLYISRRSTKEATILNNKALNSDPLKMGLDCGWYNDKDSITSVYIQNCVAPTSTAYWFSNCTVCNSFDVAGMNSSNIISTQSMFEGCIKLQNLDFINFDSSQTKIAKQMFKGCTNLTELNVSCFDTSNLENAEEMFAECISVESIYASETFDTSKVTVSNNMFLNDKKLSGDFGTNYDPAIIDKTYARLDDPDQQGYFSFKKEGGHLYYGVKDDSSKTSLYISDRPTSKATTKNDEALNTDPANMGSECGWHEKRAEINHVEIQGSVYPLSTSFWFYNLSQCDSIFMGDIDSSQSVNMSFMFTGCQNLTDVDLTHLNTENVTNMESMFSSCFKLSSLDLSGFNTVKVTNMDSMFNECRALKTIYSSDSFVVDNVSTSSLMFAGDQMLLGGNGTIYNEDKIDKEYAWADGKNNIPGYFTDRSIPALAYYGISANKEILYICKDKTAEADIPCGRIINGFSSTDELPWANDIKTIKKVEIQQSQNEIKLKMNSMNYLFSGLIYTEEFVGLGNIDTQNVVSMSHLFESDSTASYIDISGFSNQNLNDVSNMFLGCSSLNKIVANPSNWASDHEYTYIADTFKDCSESLNGVGEDGHITRWDPDHIGGDYAFVSSITKPGYFSVPDNYHLFYGLKEVGEEYVLYLSSRKTENAQEQNDAALNSNPNNTGADCGWHSARDNITSVEVENQLIPTSTAYWFSNLINCKDFDVQLINTAHTKNMECMFTSVNNLTSLDLSSWNTLECENSINMFYGCSKLKTIFVGDSFKFGTVVSSTNMFNGCTSIVGGAGTIYNSAFVDKQYARPDRPTYEPGYLTLFTGHLYYGIKSIGFEKRLYLSNMPTENAPNINDEALRSSAASQGAECAWRDEADNIESVVVENTVCPTSTAYWFSSFTTCRSINLSNINTDNTVDFSYMFKDCRGMSELDTSQFNTEKAANMEGMFCNCYSLTSVDLSSFNTAKVTDMVSLFENCSSIEELDLSSFNTYNVTSMDNMFSCCYSLKTIYTTYDFVTTYVTSSANMFLNIYNIVGDNGTRYSPHHIDKEYAVIDGDYLIPGYFSFKEDVEHLYYGIQDSAGIKTLYISKRKMNITPTNNDDALNCTSPERRGWHSSRDKINSVVVINPVKPISPAHWFERFTSCTSMNLAALDTSNAVDMNSMFYYCTTLTSLDVSSFDTSKVAIMFRMFYGCKALTFLSVSNFSDSSLTEATGMFQECNELETVDISGFNRQYKQLIHFDSLFCWDGKLKTIYASENFRLCDNVADYAFRDCNSLVGGAGTSYSTAKYDDGDYGRIDNPPDEPGYFTKKGQNELYYGISEQEGNKTLHISGISSVNTPIQNNAALNTNPGNRGSECGWHTDKGSITSVVVDSEVYPTSTACWFYEFRSCKYFDLSKIKTENTTNMNAMFYGASAAEHIDVSSFNTSKVTDMSNMFYSCRYVEELDLSTFDTSNATSMLSMFNSCNSLATIILKSFNTSKVETMYSMFDACESLKNLDLSNFDVTKVKNMDYMFRNCISLETLNIYFFNTVSLTNATYLFDNCQKLTRLDVPYFNTINVWSFSYMFRNCSSLVTIAVGENFIVSKSGFKMFAGCSKLVGGAGTIFDPDIDDETYARVDRPNEGQPGYFTSYNEQVKYDSMNNSEDLMQKNEISNNNDQIENEEDPEENAILQYYSLGEYIKPKEETIK